MSFISKLTILRAYFWGNVRFTQLFSGLVSFIPLISLNFSILRVYFNTWYCISDIFHGLNSSGEFSNEHHSFHQNHSVHVLYSFDFDDNLSISILIATAIFKPKFSDKILSHKVICKQAENLNIDNMTSRTFPRFWRSFSWFWF